MIKRVRTSDVPLGVSLWCDPNRAIEVACTYWLPARERLRALRIGPTGKEAFLEATPMSSRARSPGSILPAVKYRGQNVLKTAQLEQAMSGDYLGGRAARRFAGTPLRCLVTGFGVSAASNNCRNPCSNSSTAFPKAPSCPTRTIATDRCRSNDGGRNTFTESID